MKLKLDENLPEALVAELAALGHIIDNVRQEGLAGSDDSTVWMAAQSEKRFFITLDFDFSDVRKFQPGSHHGLMLVRLPELGRLSLIRRIVEIFRTENVVSWSGCFVVLTTHKLRVVAATRKLKREKPHSLSRIPEARLSFPR